MLAFYLSFIDTPEDEEKFVALYNEHIKFIKSTALEILKNEDLSEDATHDTFCCLAKNMKKINDVNSDETKSFIYIVAKNTALNILKKEKRLSYESFNVLPRLNINKWDFSSDIIVKDIIEQIIELPDIYRNVLELKIYYGFSNKQIAKILQIKETTVRKRLERAREKLSRFMDCEV